MKYLLTPVALMALTGIFSSTAPAPSEAPTGVDGALEEHMEQINKSIRALRKIIDQKDKRDEVLKHLGKVQAAFVATKGLEPEKAATIEDAKKKAEFLTSYRTMQIEVIEKLLDLEKVVLKGDTKKAAKGLRDILGYKKKGHDKFM